MQRFLQHKIRQLSSEKCRGNALDRDTTLRKQVAESKYTADTPPPPPPQQRQIKEEEEKDEPELAVIVSGPCTCFDQYHKSSKREAASCRACVASALHEEAIVKALLESDWPVSVPKRDVQLWANVDPLTGETAVSRALEEHWTAFTRARSAKKVLTHRKVAR